VTDAATVGDRRIGRPRDPACDNAIVQATLEAFADGGYRAVSIEGVAARSGVAKATIYRRYADKAQLLVDAIRCAVQPDDDLPDTGDLRSDLREMLLPLVARLGGKEGQLLVALAAERVLNPDLAEEFDRSVVGRKREHLRHLVGGAQERGELPRGADVDLIAETPAAIIWHHAMNGLPVDDALVERILDLIVPEGPVP
jgi:AcrR family transcriptional regulator